MLVILNVKLTMYRSMIETIIACARFSRLLKLSLFPCKVQAPTIGSDAVLFISQPTQRSRLAFYFLYFVSVGHH